MKILRLLSLLLLASPLAARAVPAISISETWKEMYVTNRITHVTSLTNAGTASLTFSGLPLANVGPINFSTPVLMSWGSGLINVPLDGDTSDPDNPIISSYKLGSTSATLTFYHNTPDANGNPQYVVVRTLTMSWAKNVLNASLTGPTGTLGFEHPSAPLTGIAVVVLRFGGFTTNRAYFYTYTNTTANGTLNQGSYTGMVDFIPPTLTITSPVPSFTTNPVIQIGGTYTDNVATWIVDWRLAAPTDDPKVIRDVGDWPLVDFISALFVKRATWSTAVTLAPGTNWFWVGAVDDSANTGPTLTRKIFYSVRSRLSITRKGNGTITGGKGVFDGAMLEIGRGYSISGKPNDTNTIFRDWRDGSFAPVSTHNPWNFLMQPNMNITGYFPNNPFPAIAGTYSGLFYDPTSPVSPGNSGYITITVKSDGTYTGTALFGTQRLPVTGKLQFDIDETDNDAVNGTTTIGKGTNLLARIRFPSDGSGQGNLLPAPSVTMTISNHTFIPLPLTLSSNVVPAGLYNMSDSLLLPTPPTNSVGCSYGSFTVTSKGQANVTLHLPDGSAPVATFSGPVGVDGSVKFFMPLYKGKGLVMGSVDLQGTTIVNSAGNQNYWVKMANAGDRYFPDGFTNGINWGGMSYSPASFTGQHFLSSLGIVRFDIRTKDLDILADGIYVLASNTFLIPPWQFGGSMHLKLNPTTGLITGNLTVNGNAVSNINILVGRTDNTAYGFAMGKSNSAAIIISGEGPNNLDTYDDGYVRFDNNALDQQLGCTAYFQFINGSQILYPDQLVLHKTIGIAAFESFEITDTYDSADVQYPNLFPLLPMPDAAPYSGVYNPGIFTEPAVMLSPSQRTTQYIEIIH